MTTANSQRFHRIVSRVNSVLDVRNEKYRKAITLLAIGVFLVGLGLSWQRLGGRIDWHLSATVLGSMLLLLVLTFAVNTLRTHAHSKIVGARLNLADNARISLFGSAMNMLPMVLPAGMLMRMSNFVQHGGKTSAVVAVLVSNYLLALLTSLLFGAVLLAFNGYPGLQAWLVPIALLYAGSFVMQARLAGIRFGSGIATLELAAVGIDAVRILLCFGMLGFGIEISQAAILTLSAIVGSAVSIVPAGLGIREVVGAGISPLIGVLPAQTFLAIALNRVFGMLFFVGLSAVVLATERGDTR